MFRVIGVSQLALSVSVRVNGEYVCQPFPDISSALPNVHTVGDTVKAPAVCSYTYKLYSQLRK